MNRLLFLAVLLTAPGVAAAGQDSLPAVTVNTPMPTGSGGTGDSGAAWTTYTPTIAPGSGTITTLGTVSAAYRKIGRLVTVRFSIAITTNGTGAGSITATLPFTAAFSAGGAGRATSVSAKALQGVISPGNIVTIYNYDGTYPAQNGETLVLSIAYESTS